MKITSNISNTTHLPSLFTISIICVTAQSNYHKANCLPIDSSRGQAVVGKKNCRHIWLLKINDIFNVLKRNWPKFPCLGVCYLTVSCERQILRQWSVSSTLSVLSQHNGEKTSKSNAGIIHLMQMILLTEDTSASYLSVDKNV